MSVEDEVDEVLASVELNKQPQKLGIQIPADLAVVKARDLKIGESAYIYRTSIGFDEERRLYVEGFQTVYSEDDQGSVKVERTEEGFRIFVKANIKFSSKYFDKERIPIIEIIREK